MSKGQNSKKGSKKEPKKTMHEKRMIKDPLERLILHPN